MNEEIEFNELNFNILKSSQPEEMGFIDHERALKLMELGYLVYKPREKWQEEGYEATSKGTELYKKWLKEIRDKHGHIWEKEENGEPDSMAFCEGLHNGFRCEKCGFEYCVHCKNEWEIPECSEESKNKKIADDSNLDSGIVAFDKQIREKIKSDLNKKEESKNE